METEKNLLDFIRWPSSKSNGPHGYIKQIYEIYILEIRKL